MNRDFHPDDQHNSTRALSDTVPRRVSRSCPPGLLQRAMITIIVLTSVENRDKRARTIHVPRQNSEVLTPQCAQNLQKSTHSDNYFLYSSSIKDGDWSFRWTELREIHKGDPSLMWVQHARWNLNVWDERKLLVIAPTQWQRQGENALCKSKITGPPQSE